MIFSLFTTATLVSLAHPAHAQSTYTLLEPLPTITETGASVMGKEINLNDYINYAINLLIAISAAAAVFMIVWGGLLYMTTDSWNGKSEGKEKVTNAIIGLLMVLSTYIILKTVNPALVAIPATLVPPITGLATSSSKDFYQSLQDDATQLSQQTTAIGNQVASNISKINADNAALQNKLNELKGQITSTSDPVVKSALDAEQKKIENQIQTNNNNKLIQETTLYFNSQLKPNLEPGTSMSEINSAIELIDKLYRKTSSTLQSNNNYDLTTLNNQHNYTDSVLKLQKIYAALGSASITLGTFSMDDPSSGNHKSDYIINGYNQLNAILTDVNSSIGNITDPTLKADLQAKFTATQGLLNSSPIFEESSPK